MDTGTIRPTEGDIAFRNRRIIIVDDNDRIHEDFKKVLMPKQNRRNDKLSLLRPKGASQDPDTKAPTFELSHALQGQDAVDMIQAAKEANKPFAMAFMDVRMPPGMDGIRTTEALWAIDPNLQIVICSAYSDYSWAQIVERLGQDERWVILRKPFDPIEVRQMASSMCRKWETNRQSNLRSEELNSLIHERTGELAKANQELAIKMSNLKDAKKHIQHLANHDSLTQLPNRRCLEERLGEALSTTENLGLLVVDLDHFKRVNDGLGHLAGDRVLTYAANTLLSVVRETDRVEIPGLSTVARFGGDEFVVMLPGIKTLKSLEAAAHRIEAALRTPVNIEGQGLRLSASIGGALFPLHGHSAQELIRVADVAMYRAKRLGRGRSVIYSSDLPATASEELGLEADLAWAIGQNELVLHYQPIVETQTMKITGVEALVRWQHPQWGLLGPFKFLPIAERTGLIDELGLWVLREGCRQLAKWKASGLNTLKMNINVSPKQLSGNGFLQSIVNALEEAGLTGEDIELELTESALVDAEGDVLQVLHALTGRGVSLALDDFGTGYSSIKNLLDLPIQTLKIDKSFIQGMRNATRNSVVVKALLMMGQGLGMRVVAEGVEELSDLNALGESSCLEIQGYYFSRPMPADQAEEFIRNFNRSKKEGVA